MYQLTLTREEALGENAFLFQIVSGQQNKDFVDLRRGFLSQGQPWIIEPNHQKF